MKIKPELNIVEVEFRNRDYLHFDFSYDATMLKIIREYNEKRYSRTYGGFIVPKNNVIISDFIMQHEEKWDIRYYKKEEKARKIYRHDLGKVFISFSFEDIALARIINRALNSKKVNTFFWEKDAAAGQTLENIMSKGIAESKMMVFINSHNSLNSKACHFELSKFIERQNIESKTLIFPIHIDNYLFEVKKEELDIPKQRENIFELRKINSMDFRDWELKNEQELNIDLNSIFEQIDFKNRIGINAEYHGISNNVYLKHKYVP